MQLILKAYKLHAAVLLGLLFSVLLQAQGLTIGGGLGGAPQDLNAQDISTMRGGGAGIGGRMLAWAAQSGSAI
ncbi:MAG: hypothetical protein WCV99_01960 [Sterolibacterium sp.]|jgi:hypothetical protein